MIIGIGYRARTGKDTIATYLDRWHGFLRVSFADSLKRCCQEVFGFSAVQLHGSSKETIDPYWGFSPRWALQTIGTELFREQIDPDIWVKSVLRRIERAPEQNWVISDVRFPNEAEAIQAMGGFVVRVDRAGVMTPRVPRALVGNMSFLPENWRTKEHESEVAMRNWNKWDQVIDNNGTILQLYPQIEAMVEDFRARQ
jgi:hypothetical protein